MTVFPDEPFLRISYRINKSFDFNVFQNEKEYVTEVINENGERRSVCTLCNANFTQKRSAFRHVRGIHLGQHYRCPLCQFVCKWSYEMPPHIRVTHETEPNDIMHLVQTIGKRT